MFLANSITYLGVDASFLTLGDKMELTKPISTMCLLHETILLS